MPRSYLGRPGDTQETLLYGRIEVLESKCDVLRFACQATLGLLRELENKWVTVRRHPSKLAHGDHFLSDRDLVRVAIERLETALKGKST